MAGVFKWLRAIFPNIHIDKRRLQAEIDVHRLLLLTSAYPHLAKGVKLSDAQIQAITASATDKTFEQIDAALQQNLANQLQHIAMLTHHALLSLHDHRAEQHQAMLDQATQRQEDTAAAPRVGGLAFAVGNATPKGAPSQSSSSNTSDTPLSHSSTTAQQHIRHRVHDVTMDTLSRAFHEASAFSLDVSPSAVDHPDAGMGVWLRGMAMPGQVVALYPGLVYPQDMHKYMPGYPSVSNDNDYLFARHDGAILDAQPWGMGPLDDVNTSSQPGAPTWPVLSSVDTSSTGQTKTSQTQTNAHQTNSKTSADNTNTSSTTNREQNRPAARRLWSRLIPGQVTAQERAAAAAQQVVQWNRLAHICEGRHPLARGHLINHPGKDSQPNVLQAAFTIQPSPARHIWRRYLPNCTYATNLTSALEGGDWINADDGQEPVVGLALVATRQIQDEELLLNYRLSVHVPRPEWYHPVDAAEDERRWA